MNTFTSLLGAVAIAVAFVAPICADADGNHGDSPRSTYRITDLGSLGGTESFAYAINDAGQVVGYSRITGDAGGESFLYTNGEMISLSPLNSEDILTVGPTSINNRGQVASGIISQGTYYPAIYDICTDEVAVLGSLGGVTSYDFSGVSTSINELRQSVGYSYLDASNRHAFLHNEGLMTDIGTLGGREDYSSATAINDDGMIVGFSSNQLGGQAHAFVYADGVMTDIGPFGDSESYANDVNNRGQVVGTFLTEDRSAFHAFLYSDGVFTDLGSAISPDTSAQAINDSGQIVGIWFLPYEDLCYDFELNDYVPCIKYEQQAFIYRNRRMKNLNDLIPPFSGWDLIAAFDINDRGQIVGYGLRGDKIHAFLMTLRGHACEHSERCLSPACTPPRKAAQRQHLRGEMPAPLIVEPASGAKRRASWHMRGEALPERRR